MVFYAIITLKIIREIEKIIVSILGGFYLGSRNYILNVNVLCSTSVDNLLYNLHTPRIFRGEEVDVYLYISF